MENGAVAEKGPGMKSWFAKNQGRTRKHTNWENTASGSSQSPPKQQQQLLQQQQQQQPLQQQQQQQQRHYHTQQQRGRHNHRVWNRPRHYAPRGGSNLHAFGSTPSSSSDQNMFFAAQHSSNPQRGGSKHRALSLGFQHHGPRNWMHNQPGMWAEHSYDPRCDPNYKHSSHYMVPTGNNNVPGYQAQNWPLIQTGMGQQSDDYRGEAYSRSPSPRQKSPKNIVETDNSAAGSWTAEVPYTGEPLSCVVDRNSLLSSTIQKQVACTIWDDLSRDAWAKFRESEQSELMFKDKIVVWNELDCLIKKSYPHYKLYIVGSTINGFACHASDLDVCLIVRQAPMDQRCEAYTHLEQVMSVISSVKTISKLTFLPANIPLLKFSAGKMIDVDLNCNNYVGIHNTHLLYCYSQLDWRVRPMVILIKTWAKYHNINDAKISTISSYSLVLMVLHFLQCGVTPEIIPCLHSLYPEKFSIDNDIYKLIVQEKLSSPYFSKNTLFLGDLLTKFMEYYSSFDFLNYAISVRLGKKICKDQCNFEWACLNIEEPFNRTNTARSVYDHITFEKVKNVFLTSMVRLKREKDLNAILREI